MKQGLTWMVIWLSGSLFGQVEEQPLDEERWQDLTENLDYDEPGQKRIKEQPLDEQRWEDLTEDLDYREERDSVATKTRTSWGPKGTQIDSGFVKFLLIGLVIALLTFLILRLATPDLFKRKQAVKSSRHSTHNIAELEVDELDQALKDALRSGDLRLAVRIYYLIVIRELAAHRIINWHLEKTNNQYVVEMTGHPLIKPFSASTRAYERVWFGEEDLNPTGFSTLEAELKHLITQIRTK
jgi:hypothetical protein